MTRSLFPETPDSQDSPELAPGFMVVHGNHAEALRDLLVAWMTRHPLAPLENEVVLVQSNGIAQWLKLALARDRRDGGMGIAAALDAQLPSRFIWRAYRAVLGTAAVPDASPFDRERLVWRLMRLLPVLVQAEAVFLPLQRFLEVDPDGRRLHQLAQRLADLFDQYQVYRADWLADWAAGDDVIATSRQGRQAVPADCQWQPRLWRALQDDAGELAASSRAEVHRRFLAELAAQGDEALAMKARAHGLPRRVMVFGISSLPQQSLEVLAAIARFTQVLMCVHNPCAHHWADIAPDRDLLRAERTRQPRKIGMPAVIAEDELHLHANPLLAAWGKQGRDFIGLLDLHDERERYEAQFLAIQQRTDLFRSNAPDDMAQQPTLLHRLQDDILELRPVTETRALWPTVDVARDRSVRFHIVHGAQREVEVLHDQLLDAFAHDPSLRPRDVIVMVPDINAYAPHIRAVFGLAEPGDARHIPYTLADQGQRHHDPLLGALESLLGLPQSRVAAGDLLDLLEVPSLRRRFGIDESQLPLVHRWISAANIRWGLHAAQRASLALPEGDGQNTWSFGLRRMLLGYAVGTGGAGEGGSSGEAWQGIEPLDEIGGLDAALLGPLVALVDQLELTWRTLAEPASPNVWAERLGALLADFFDAGESDDGFTLLRLQTALGTWQTACAAAGLTEPLPLAVVRDHWLTQLEQGGLNQPFFAGSVTFATLMPMRAIPFRRVCLLGMNDGDYPRTRPPVDFDLMGRDWRPGDRSRRDDDRYLFLEALLSARERLHISWVGRSIHDNAELPPSVLVAQLRDHIAAAWRLAGPDDADAALQRKAGVALVEALTTHHRLQPFDRAYFTAAPAGSATLNGGDALFSYAREWREGLRQQSLMHAQMRAQMQAQARAGQVAASAAGGTLLEPLATGEALTLRQLARFAKEPVREFMQGRLGVHFDLPDPSSQDQEPFALDALENWKLQDELIAAQRAAVEAGTPREDALHAQIERIARRGALPPGAFAGLVAEQLAEPMERLFTDYARTLDEWPLALPDDRIEHETQIVGEPLLVADWLGHMRANAVGERARVLLESSGLVKERRWRRDKLLPFWVQHVAGHLAGQPLTTVVVSKVGTVRLEPLTQQHAIDHWTALLEAWHEGMRWPLPVAAKTGFAWLEKGGSPSGSMTSEAGKAARKRYEPEGAAAGMPGGAESESPYLQRVWPDFDALWAEGDFAFWANRLLKPLLDATGKPPPAERKGGD